MFELPRAKRVRRDELQSPVSSRASSPDDAAIEQFRARQLDYQIIEHTADTHEARKEEDEQEAEFNLFARPKTGTTSQPAKIQLRSPSPNAEVYTVAIGRPDSYYFTGELDTDLLEQYRISAVSGPEVQHRSLSYWPGSFYRWKVTTIPASRNKVGTTSEATVKEQTTTKRARLGKKGRIKKRRIMATAAERKEAEKTAKEDKERAEREKKARRNREKKFKKRARDKAKKQGAAATGNGVGDGSGEDDSD
ncbi:hypothetical protein C1H76_3356 [Elsinoe australis]|uniref:Uncharacterized protein n=1 Tax=Elsinoe australis TaxID=40998 RepID=A0A4U7B112_9PEZI|nr:hypothetical protein C1H76_3356 [Elsinoe australis]